MKKFLLGTTAALFFAAPAIAADLPVKAPPAAVVAAVYNWTGFYVGIQGGYGWGRSRHCDAGSTPQCGEPVLIFPDFSIRGWTAGGTVGYNHQIGNLVLGVELDGSWANIRGESGDTVDFGCGPIGNPADKCVTQIRAFGTARARFGYAFGRFLPYVTGGVAVTRLHGAISTASNPAAQNTTTRTRGVVGGGAEFALANNWSAKGEFIHVFRLGDHAYDLVGECGTPGCFTRNSGYGVVRAGLNYRFGGPVVARY
jgi:outer membrane immunogenic protein